MDDCITNQSSTWKTEQDFNESFEAFYFAIFFSDHQDQGCEESYGWDPNSG